MHNFRRNSACWREQLPNKPPPQLFVCMLLRGASGQNVVTGRNMAIPHFCTVILFFEVWCVACAGHVGAFLWPVVPFWNTFYLINSYQFDPWPTNYSLYLTTKDCWFHLSLPHLFILSQIYRHVERLVLFSCTFPLLQPRNSNQDIGSELTSDTSLSLESMCWSLSIWMMTYHRIRQTQ